MGIGKYGLFQTAKFASGVSTDVESTQLVNVMKFTLVGIAAVFTILLLLFLLHTSPRRRQRAVSLINTKSDNTSSPATGEPEESSIGTEQLNKPPSGTEGGVEGFGDGCLVGRIQQGAVSGTEGGIEDLGNELVDW